MVATLSKNGVHKIAESEEILQTISLLASSLLSETHSMDKYYPYINELFLLASKVLVGMQGIAL